MSANVQEGQLIADKYRLLKRLGSGTLGEVWSARNEVIEREVAIKVIVPPLPLTSVMVRTFFAGVSSSGRLRHPCVVELLDLLELDGSPLVVTELLDAEKLQNVLTRRGSLSVGASLRIVADLARALSEAHQQRFWHGRVEPANILLHRDLRGQVLPKLVDFGIGRFVDEQLKRRRTAQHSTELLSHLSYLCPDQVARVDAEVDGRPTDVWALGVLLHHCITGSPPYPAKSLNELRDLQRAPRKMLHELDPSIDEELSQLGNECLMRTRASRPTAQALAERAEVLLQRIPDGWEELAADVSITEQLDATLLRSIRPAAMPRSPEKTPRAPPIRPAMARHAQSDAPSDQPPSSKGGWQWVAPVETSSPSPAAAPQPVLSAPKPANISLQTSDVSLVSPPVAAVRATQPVAVQPVSPKPVASNQAASKPVASNTVAIKADASMDWGDPFQPMLRAPDAVNIPRISDNWVDLEGEAWQPRRSRWGVVLVLTLMLLAGIGVGAYFWVHEATSSTLSPANVGTPLGPLPNQPVPVVTAASASASMSASASGSKSTATPTPSGSKKR